MIPVAYYIFSLLAVSCLSHGDQCTGGKEMNPCGSLCAPTCISPKPYCPLIPCRFPGCRCPDGLVEEEGSGECMPLELCPNQAKSECPADKYYTTCANICPPTCATPHPPPQTCTIPIPCVPGCRCQKGLVEHMATGKCYLSEDCPPEESNKE
eukprot:m.11610 g.11610  ORF g.11610 m.11610 type:complete len:153 (+) comp23521_c0_seq1:94-552(+)